MALLNAVIDLSHHNIVANFQQIRSSGIIGVIHKATESKSFVDANYAERRKAAHLAGILFGSYHFAANGDPEGQADHYLDVIEDHNELMVLDFEPNSREGTMTLPEAEAFVGRIHQQTGRFPGLYSGESFINAQLEGATDTILKNCFLWIAKYSAERPKIPAIFPTFTLWQYTDGSAGPQPHTVPGVGGDGRCDRDKFNGDEAGLRRLLGQP